MSKVTQINANDLAIIDDINKYPARHLIVGKEYNDIHKMIKELLLYYDLDKHVTRRYIITPTGHAKYYTSYMPLKDIYNKIDNESLGIIMEIARLNSEMNQKTIIVLDDYSYNSDIWTSNIYQLLFNVRSYGIILIIGIKNDHFLAPSIRDDVDYIYLMPEDRHIKLELLYEQFKPNFNSCELFTKIFNYLMQNGKIMILQNKQRQTYWL